MSQEKYIGMDVHQATISVAVMDGNGKLLMECLLATKAATILEFVQGLRGTLSLTFEEGSCNQEFGFEPNICMSSSTICNLSASKRDANYCGRATNTLR